MYRFAVASLLLVITASANAGIEVRMEVTDRGAVDRDTFSYAEADFNSVLGQPTNPGDELLVHIFMRSDSSLDIRSMQVQWTSSSYPAALMGVDTDTNNPAGGPDGLPNFWFDYTATIAAVGQFPANGFVNTPFGPLSSTGSYTDFSNVMQGNPLAPTAASSGFIGTAGFGQIPMVAGEWAHIGAMPIVTPESGTESYGLDFVTATGGDDVNLATFIQHGFDPSQLIASAGGDDTLVYAGGARGTGLGGPVDYNGATGVFSIVPEPATLALLGFGGIAALRRRRKAA